MGPLRRRKVYRSAGAALLALAALAATACSGGDGAGGAASDAADAADAATDGLADAAADPDLDGADLPGDATPDLTDLDTTDGATDLGVDAADTGEDTPTDTADGATEAGADGDENDAVEDAATEAGADAVTDGPDLAEPDTASDADADAGDASDAEADASDAPTGPPTVLFPRMALTADELGVIVNTDDPLSASFAAAYVEARGVPEDQVLEVSMGTAATLSADAFADVEAAIDDFFGPEVQALVLTSLHPYRVDCMGVSAAVALGFDPIYCQAGPPCLPTAPVDYYNSDSTHPYTDHGLRPTMILAAQSLDEAQALIERGIASDGTYPPGHGWFVRTTDAARSVRYFDFEWTVPAWDRDDGIAMTYVDNADGSGSNVIADEADVLFYFTGLASVPDIATNTYVPGAVADHLTSFGGALPGGGQMSALAWLQAGATASYGTAVEPCNYQNKFPRTSVFVPHYFRGETVVEAYWKSVNWPGEGNFVGEPLARPFGPPRVEWAEGVLTIETTLMVPGQTYALEAATAEDGPWTPALAGLSVDQYRRETVVLEEAWSPWYRLVEVE